jgi:ABC-2 type transport system ATP-binding protein
MLAVVKLTKRYSSIPVVNDVSFTVEPGKVLGYLGPNGSGKSTTVKMLTGLLLPSEGQILFGGRDIQQQLIEYKSTNHGGAEATGLGYVPEDAQLYNYLTGREYLQLVGRLRGLPPKALNRKIDDFLQLFSLHKSRHSALSSYSKGMRQKILITAALLHNPEVLILDEPESGLDVTSALVFRNLIKELAIKGKIILYSSHVLEVVEKVCSQIVILHKGRMMANDSVENLRLLMQLPSLGDIFAQLVIPEDTEKLAREIVQVMEQ